MIIVVILLAWKWWFPSVQMVSWFICRLFAFLFFFLDHHRLRSLRRLVRKQLGWLVGWVLATRSYSRRPHRRSRVWGRGWNACVMCVSVCVYRVRIRLRVVNERVSEADMKNRSVWTLVFISLSLSPSLCLSYSYLFVYYVHLPDGLVFLPFSFYCLCFLVVVTGYISCFIWRISRYQLADYYHRCWWWWWLSVGIQVSTLRGEWWQGRIFVWPNRACNELTSATISPSGGDAFRRSIWCRGTGWKIIYRSFVYPTPTTTAASEGILPAATLVRPMGQLWLEHRVHVLQTEEPGTVCGLDSLVRGSYHQMSQDDTVSMLHLLWAASHRNPESTSYYFP